MRTIISSVRLVLSTSRMRHSVHSSFFYRQLMTCFARSRRLDQEISVRWYSIFFIYKHSCLNHCLIPLLSLRLPWHRFTSTALPRLHSWAILRIQHVQSTNFGQYWFMVQCSLRDKLQVFFSSTMLQTPLFCPCQSFRLSNAIHGIGQI